MTPVVRWLPWGMMKSDANQIWADQFSLKQIDREMVCLEQELLMQKQLLSSKRQERTAETRANKMRRGGSFVIIDYQYPGNFGGKVGEDEEQKNRKNGKNRTNGKNRRNGKMSDFHDCGGGWYLKRDIHIFCWEGPYNQTMYIPQGFNHMYGIPLIMEVGSLNTKIGFAGKERPDLVAPSYVQVNRTNGEKVELDFYNSFARENSDPESILESCFIDDWEGFQTLTTFTLGKKLLVNPSEHPMFYIEPPLSSKEYRQKLIELFFEEYEFNGLFMHKAPVLSTYLFGLESSLVVDIGAEYTHVVPVVEGFINPKGIIRANVGGESITRQLYKQVQPQLQQGSIGNYFSNGKVLTDKMNEWGHMEIMREVKHQHCHLLESRHESISYNDFTDKTAYELPDKNKVIFGKELFMAPEVYFNQKSEDGFKGIHHLISQSLEKCDPDQRKELVPNIQLVGGGSSFSTTPDRLQRELLQADFNGYGPKMKVFTTNEKSQRSISSWLGATIMSSMRIFDKWIVSRKEYEQNGFVHVQKRL